MLRQTLHPADRSRVEQNILSSRNGLSKRTSALLGAALVLVGCVLLLFASSYEGTAEEEHWIAEMARCQDSTSFGGHPASAVYQQGHSVTNVRFHWDAGTDKDFGTYEELILALDTGDIYSRRIYNPARPTRITVETPTRRISKTWNAEQREWSADVVQEDRRPRELRTVGLVLGALALAGGLLLLRAARLSYAT